MKSKARDQKIFRHFTNQHTNSQSKVLKPICRHFPTQIFINAASILLLKGKIRRRKIIFQLFRKGHRGGYEEG